LFTGTNATGTVSFTQQGVLSIKLNDAITTFGNVTSTAAGTCTIDTEATQTNCVSTVSNDKMQLENDGNVNAVVDANSTKDRAAAPDPSSFNLGTGGAQSIKATNAETGACSAGTAYTVYATLANTSGSMTRICDSLNYDDNADALTIDYRLVIGQDLTPGNYTENVTFWASLA
jgi:hypothetical protein